MLRYFHTKWSKPDRKIQVSGKWAYMESKNNYTNELLYKTKIDSQIENKPMVTNGEWGKI